MTKLSKLNPGQSGTVVVVDGDSPVTRRLTELGLVPGRPVKHLRNAPMNDPMEIQIGSACISLRHAEASLVAVEVEAD